MGGGGSSDSQVYTNLIPTYINGMQDLAIGYLTDAMVLSYNTFEVYSDPTYAIQNTNETGGIAAMGARGAAGSVIEIDAETYLQTLYSGEYLQTNPRLDLAFQKGIEEIIQQFNEYIMPAIQNTFSFAFGGSEHNIEEAKAAEKMMDTINELGQKIYYDDYRLERRIQDAGMSHAVPYSQRLVRDAEIQRSAGVYAREYLQALYKDNWAKWNENNVIPVRNLDILGNAIKTIMGTTRQQNTTYYKPSTFTQIAGLALTGMGVYNLFRGTSLNPYVNPSGSKNMITQDQGVNFNQNTDAKIPTLNPIESYTFGQGQE